MTTTCLFILEVYSNWHDNKLSTFGLNPLLFFARPFPKKPVQVLWGSIKRQALCLIRRKLQLMLDWFSTDTTHTLQLPGPAQCHAGSAFGIVLVKLQTTLKPWPPLVLVVIYGSTTPCYVNVCQGIERVHF